MSVSGDNMTREQRLYTKALAKADEHIASLQKRIAELEAKPHASAGLIEAAAWLDRQAIYHERNASDEPNDAKPEMTEGDCSKAISGYLRKAAHNLRARASNRSRK